MSRPDILTQIAASVEKRLAARKAALPLEKLLQMVSSARKPRAFTEQLRGGLKVIAEVKFRSPSQSESGFSSNSENAVQIAGSYLQGGASALSILTEEDHFNGSLEYLHAIRARFPESFLLMKDFVIDVYQLAEAVVYGADCVLLIVALLDEEKLKELYERAVGFGLSVLVEVHDEAEMKIALSLKAPLIGINNRNLKTLKISLDTSRGLAPLAPQGTVLICESGIEKASEMSEMHRLGFSGFLIGTSLMKTSDPGKTLSGLLKEARG
jgi:indole-3-glycerol phosphate synthase